MLSQISPMNQIINRAPYLCLFFVFGFAAFLFRPSDSLLKYAILFSSALCIIFSYQNNDIKKSLESYREFIFPWLPWYICVIPLTFFHDDKNIYLNGLLLLSLPFFALSKIAIKRQLVIFVISITASLLSATIVFDVLLNGLTQNILGVNKNVLVPCVTLLAICSFAFLLFESKDQNLTLKITLIFSVCISVVCIILTEVRTAILALLSLIPLTILLNKKNRLKHISLLLLICGVTIICFYFSGRLQQGIDDLVRYQAGNPNSSWGIRLELWKLSLDAFMIKPIFGWGEEAFAEMIKAGCEFPVSSFHPGHSHNDFFNILVSIGAVGVLCWISTIFLLLKNSATDPTRISFLIATLAMGLTERLFLGNRACCYLTAIIWLLLYLTSKSKTTAK